MRPGNRLRRWMWALVIFLAAIGTAVALRRIVNLLPIVIDGYHPPAARSAAAAQFAALDDLFAHYPILTLIHIVPGMLFMLLGPWQFSASIRARHLRWHRFSGRLFVICGAIVGVSALVMSFAMPAIGGVNQAAATAIFGAFFLFALGRAYWMMHREWMIRAFATGLAVATIRPIIGMFFATSRLTGMTPHEFFGTAFWIGFTLQVMVAEVWIQMTRGAREAGSLVQG
jgi:hypothetical protein